MHPINQARVRADAVADARADARYWRRKAVAESARAERYAAAYENTRSLLVDANATIRELRAKLADLRELRAKIADLRAAAC